MLVVADLEQAKYITLITRQARIKRMELSQLANVRSNGIIAMNLDANDSLDWARLTNGDEDLMVITRNGKALRFHERTVRPMGRTAAGVMAMRLIDDDQVVSLDVVKAGADLLVLHEFGWGKRVSLDEYNAKGRYTQGMWTTAHDRLDEIGPIVAARVAFPADQITVMTSNGIALRTQVSGISRYGRMTRGVRVVNLQDGDTVAAVAVISDADLNRGVDGALDGEDQNGVANGAAPVVAGAGDANDELEIVPDPVA
jgi:DNA gyrase subunit A